MKISSGGGASQDSALPKTEDVISRLMARLENRPGTISACPEHGNVYKRLYGSKYYRAMAVLYDNCESPSAGNVHVGDKMSSRQYYLQESFCALMDYVDNNPPVAQGKRIVNQLYTQSISSSRIPDQNPSHHAVIQIRAWIKDYLVPSILGTEKRRLRPTLATSERGPSGSAQSSASSPNEEIINKWKLFLADPSDGLPLCEKTTTEYRKQFGNSRMHALAALIDLCSLRSTSHIPFRRKTLKWSFTTLSKTKPSAQSNIYVKQGTLIANELVSLIQNLRYAIESDESDGPFDVLSKFVDILLPDKENHPPSLTFVPGGSNIVPNDRDSNFVASMERISRLLDENQTIRPQSNQVSDSLLSSNLYSTVSKQDETMPGPSGIQQEQVSGLLPPSPQAPTSIAITASRNHPGTIAITGQRPLPISHLLKFAAIKAVMMERRLGVGTRETWEKLVNIQLRGKLDIEVYSVGIRLFLQFGTLGSTITNVPRGSYFDEQDIMPLSQVLQFLVGLAQNMEATGFEGTVDAFIPVQVAATAIIQPSGPTQYKLGYEVESNITTTGRVLQQGAGPSHINDFNQVNNINDLQSGGLYQMSGTQVEGAGSEVDQSYDSEMFKDLPIALRRPSKRQKTQHSASDQDQKSQITSSGASSTQGNNEQGR